MTKKIDKTSTVAMHFKMKAENGEVAKDTYEEKPVQFKMGDGSFSEAFEAAMMGLTASDKKTITLKPDDAFGEPNPDNIYDIPAKRFPPDMKLEKDLAVAFDYVGDNEMVGIVKEFDAAFVTVDFNHPLSGQEITFDVEVLEVS